MSAALPGNRDLPDSQYDLSTYWGRVRHAADIADPRCPSVQFFFFFLGIRRNANKERMMLVSPSSLDNAKRLISSYKENHIPKMTPELWQAKKVVDSTLHPDNGEPVFLPFRMSSYVMTNLIVTGGMLTPGLKVLFSSTVHVHCPARQMKG